MIGHGETCQDEIAGSKIHVDPISRGGGGGGGHKSPHPQKNAHIFDIFLT